MKKHIAYLFFLILFLFTSFQTTWTQERSSRNNYPSDVEKWRFVLNGSFEIFHPTNVAKVDNNWKILLTCLSGKTMDELKETGISFKKSQLMLLQGMQFIKEEEGTFRTVLPILGEEQMQTIRAAARDLSIELEPQLQKDVNNLKKLLTKTGLESSMFTLLFSIGLDNVPIYYAIQEGLIRKEQLSTESYLWSGQFYAYYPPRGLECGTNSYGGNGIYICLNWSDEPWEKIQKYFNSKNLNTLSQEYLKHGKIMNEDLKNSLAETDIFDNEGNLTVPILKKTGDNLLYNFCYNIREKAGKLFIGNIDFKGLMQKCDLYDEVIAMTVFYHEWEWEFMGLLEERGLIERPFAFTNPEEAGPKDIGTLLFFMDER